MRNGEVGGVTFRGARETQKSVEPSRMKKFGPSTRSSSTRRGAHEDMRQFFRALPRILAKGGVFSFFNGLAPFNPFFTVACEFVKCETRF